MKSNIFFPFVCIALIFSFKLNANAQGTGKITGTIVDAESGETLIGVNVVLENNPSKGGSSDLDGRYTISNLRPGSYNLVVTYVSFARQLITDVEVKTGQVLQLDIVMEPETEELDEVVITAGAILDNEAGLLRQRQKSVAFSDAISSESMSRSGAGDAASAMSKVTGATVVGGKYVYVRGLGGRYSSTHLNGMELPSSDPDKKSFQMDLIPAGLLDNIVTLKTFTPDKPGNFSGGIVDLGTKSFPEQLLLKFSYSNSYNQNANLNNNFLAVPGNEKNALGFRSVPDVPNVLSDPNTSVPQYRSNPSAENARLLDTYTKSFGNYMGPVQDGQSRTNQGFSASIGNQLSLFGRQLGYLASYTYGNNYSYYSDGATERYRLSDENASELNPQLVLDDAKGTHEVNSGLLIDLQYKLSATNKISGNYFYSRNQQSTARYQDGIWAQEFGANDTLSSYINRVLHFIDRSIKSYQLRGDHVIEALNKASVKWSYSNSSSVQSEPDLRYFTSVTRVLYPDANPIYTPSSSNWRDPSRFYRDLEDDNSNMKLDISIPFNQWDALTAKFKFGGALLNADRKFRERIFTYRVNGTFFNEIQGDANAFFGNNYLGVIRIDTTGSPQNPNYRYRLGNVIQDGTQKRNNYDGSRTVAAAYGMLELPISDKLKFVGGLRYETTEMDVASLDTLQRSAELDKNDWLPSANMIYELTSGMNLRISASRTLARPNFRELVPYETIQFVNDETLRGNPNLERTLITNFDARWEWFMGPGEVLAISGYYKNLQNPIELTYATGQVLSNPILQYQNVDEAVIKGVEFEVRKNLGFIASPLRHFTGGFNLSLINSEITLSESELEARRAINPSQSDIRDLQGQSPYVINADLNYQNPRSGTVIGLYYNVFGPRLSNVGAGITPDVYERPQPKLDLNASQKFLRHFNLKLSVTNILDSKFSQTYSYRGEEFIYQEYSRGTTFKVGISYEL
ncbi:MAG: TonB-dependent receptor [Balneolaceae bacterium]|nr:TonB-dependent receptor [Balneolaceae bacterium]